MSPSLDVALLRIEGEPGQPGAGSGGSDQAFCLCFTSRVNDSTSMSQACCGDV
jgi:hypothetical protein